MLSVKSLTKNQAFQDVSFNLHEGEIIGIAGVLGSGKSVLASSLAGLTTRDAGTVDLKGKTLQSGDSHHAIGNGIGYVPAERNLAGIIGAHSIEWNLTLPALDRVMSKSGFVISSQKSASLTEKWIQKLRVRCSGRGALARHLSGGNQQKIVFAKWLSRGVDVLILDEPGRGLDVGAKEEIYELIRETAEGGAAILLISDNLPELIGLSNRILVMRGGRVTAEFPAPVGAKPEEASILKYMI